MPSKEVTGTRFAAWVAEEKEISEVELWRNVFDLEEATEVCLLLVAKRTERDDIILSLCSHYEKQCTFELSNLLGSLHKILDSIVYHPFKLVKTIEVISNYDCFRLREWMKVDPPKPSTTIHNLVNRHYRERPAYIAVSSTSGNITYEDLGKRSAMMAQKLIDYGVQAGGVVGFCVEKSASSLVVLLAILRAGAGYVPISTSDPVDRIEHITRKAGIQVLVVESAILERLKGRSGFSEVQTTTPSALERLEAPSIDWTQELDISPTQVAYIMFTSGSTGQPKGVVHQHAAVSGALEAVTEKFGLDCSTKFLQFASFSFDASICELFAPWVAGGTVCIPSEEERLGDLEGIMHQLDVTDASLTPSIAVSLRPEALPRLKHLYIGGEPPTAHIVSTWAGKVRLSNIYGLTEGGVWDTVELSLAPTDNPKTIGRGIGARCWIVDPDNTEKLQPIGVDGEVVLQSPYLAHQYLDDTAKSKEAFISLPRPFSTLAEPFPARCYRTGDLARWRPDGKMIFIGRRAGFVKIRGMRVELGEIEKGILRFLHEGERAAVVLAGDNNGKASPELVAFIEQKDGGSSKMADQMSANLKNILPPYMIPSAFVPIQSMPLTDSKKIHRQHLITHWASLTFSGTFLFRPGAAFNPRLSRIDPFNSQAVELSNMVADVIEAKSGSPGESLRGWDFVLTSVGLDSIQLSFLTGEIRRRFGGDIRIQDLQKPGISVCGINQRLSLQGNGGSDLYPGSSPSRDLLCELGAIDIPVSAHTPIKQTVFATSVTGFLGSQVLRVLLEEPKVGHIVGLVRSGSEEEARDKIRTHAQIGQWWRDEFETQIEVWLGDLSLPKLGLDNAHWTELVSTKRINGIIHNGARVNWLDDFSTLKPTNVDSTRTILEALSIMPSPCPFTYVSGGYLPLPTESRVQILDNLAHACGYDQTKFLSRMTVEKYNLQIEQGPDPSAPRARVIQPGYLVGTRWEGIAQSEDFLWRLAFSIMSLGTVSCEMYKAHIPVAGVEQMALLIVESVLSPHGKKVIDCHDGVSIGILCSILSNQSGRPIKTVDHCEWVTALRADVEKHGLAHPFLPVLPWFEANIVQFTCMRPPEWSPAINQRDTIAALEKSTDYLLNIGFFPTGNETFRPLDQRSVRRFRRSCKEAYGQ
ncbi:Nonribosomal peptide synthetase 8 [Penicillium rolfsii]|nr:Nonribosomal peptide synthetase 8 [Penicillium rolfsii]